MLEKKKVTLKKKKKKKKHLRQESEPGLRNGWWGWCGEDGAESHEEEETGRSGDWGAGAGGTSAWQWLGPGGGEWGRWAQLWGHEVEKLSRVCIQSPHGRQCSWAASSSLTPSPLPWSEHLAVFTQNDCSFLSLHGGSLLRVLTLLFPLTPLLLLGSVSFSDPSLGKLIVWLGLGPLSSSQHPVFSFTGNHNDHRYHNDTYIDVNLCRCLIF